MIKDLEGKTALVTGGARGIGRGITDRLVAAGALVAIADNWDGAAQVAAKIEAGSGKAFALYTQLGAPGAIEALVSALDAELIRRTGVAKLDILVNNIGGSDWASIETTTTEQFDRMFSNNVRAPFFLTQTLLPRLRDGGRVINISSAGARIAGSDFIAYAMFKSALETFTRVLAKDLGPRGITVNSVAPGWTATESNAEAVSDPAMVKNISGMTLLGRFGRPEDIGDFVHALASSAGRWVTGQNIEASGGFRF